MRRALIVRILVVWLAFGLGAAAGAWIVEHNAAACKTQLVDFDIGGLENAALSALPAAETGSGIVTFALEPTGIHVHADSAFANQTFDARVAALVRGSPVTIEMRADLVQRLLGH